MTDQPYTSASFGWALKRFPLSRLTADAGFVAYAVDLTERFAAVDMDAVRQDRAGLGDYLDYVRATRGLGVSLEELATYVESGLPSRLEAVLMSRLCRNSGDHARSRTLLEDVFERSGQDAYVGHFYGEAMAAVGEIDGLDALAHRIIPSLVRELNPVFAGRWVELLLSMMRLPAAREVLAASDVTRDAREIFDYRLRTYEAPADALGDIMPTMVINLANEPRKMQLSARLLGDAGHRIARQEAVAGANLPLASLKWLCPDDRVRLVMSAGSIACSLSHIAAWEKLASSQESSMLVVEDDAGPFTHSSEIAHLAQANDFDFLFVNERMSELVNSGKLGEQGTFSPWEQCAEWAPARKGWGFDGYVLSRRGAERALDLVDQIGIRGHVDAQFGSYSATPSGPATNPIQSQVEEFRRGLGDRPSLEGRCARIPGIKVNSFGVTSTVTAGV